MKHVLFIFLLVCLQYVCGAQVQKWEDWQSNFMLTNGSPSALPTQRNIGLNLWYDKGFGAELHFRNNMWGTALFTRSNNEAIWLGNYNANTSEQQYFNPWMTLVDGKVGIGTISPVSNLTVTQTSTNKNGLWLTGAEYYDPIAGNDINNGISLTLGVNRPGNRQVWVGSSQVTGSSTLGLLRFITGTPVPLIDAVTGNGAARLNLCLGSATTNVMIGNDDSPIIPANKITVYGNSSIGTGYYNIPAPEDGMIVQGNVGIGTTDTKGYSLAVAGSTGVVAERFVVKQQANWPDYVFHPAYELRSLSSLESYINEYKHLPGVPAAADVEKDGVDMGATQATLLKKIEELTLYVINLQKEVDSLKKK